jgi:hypothetical protein
MFPKFMSDQPLVHYGKLFEKMVLRTIQKVIEDRNLLNGSQFGSRVHHNMILKLKRLTDHVTLNYNNNNSTSAVFSNVDKASDTTKHSGLLHKVSELQFPTSLVKLIANFLTNKKFKISIEGLFSTPKEMAAGVPRGSILDSNFTFYM